MSRCSVVHPDAGLGQNVPVRSPSRPVSPYSVPAATIGMVCGSGMKSVIERLVLFCPAMPTSRGLRRIPENMSACLSRLPDD